MFDHLILRVERSVGQSFLFCNAVCTLQLSSFSLLYSPFQATVVKGHLTSDF